MQSARQASSGAKLGSGVGSAIFKSQLPVEDDKGEIPALSTAACTPSLERAGWQEQAEFPGNFVV